MIISFVLLRELYNRLYLKLNYLKKFFTCLSSFFAILLIFGFSSQIISESTWFTSSISFLYTKNNFHEIVPGKLYRSAVLSKADLEKSITDYGIKTIIDLRKGEDNGNLRELSEREIVESLGAAYKWIPLVGTNTKQKESISKLISLSEMSTGPVLIHCSSGSHRSGVATAIWLMLTEKIEPNVAAEQLSTKYGFFYWERRLKSFFLGHETIDDIIWQYLNEYRQNGVKFKSWLNSRSQ